MFRGLDESAAPDTSGAQRPPTTSPSTVQQRIDEERQKQPTTPPRTLWEKIQGNGAEDQRAREANKAKRDSWLYEDTRYSTTMKPEESKHYETSQANEKYVKYYDPSARDMEYNGPHKKPPHPRQRHRCDYHLEDILQSATDGRYPVWDAMKIWAKCMWSDVGQEPERIRKEVWKW